MQDAGRSSRDAKVCLESLLCLTPGVRKRHRSQAEYSDSLRMTAGSESDDDDDDSDDGLQGADSVLGLLAQDFASLLDKASDRQSMVDPSVTHRLLRGAARRDVKKLVEILEGANMVQRNSDGYVKWAECSEEQLAKISGLRGELQGYEDELYLLDRHIAEVKASTSRLMAVEREQLFLLHTDLATAAVCPPTGTSIGLHAPTGARLVVPEPDTSMVYGAERLEKRRRYQLEARSAEGPIEVLMLPKAKPRGGGETQSAGSG